jgi:hypothetical protein
MDRLTEFHRQHLTFHSVTLIKNLHVLHLDEWRFHLLKSFC